MDHQRTACQGLSGEPIVEDLQVVELRSPVPKSAEPNVLRVMAGTAKKVEIYQGGSKPVKIWRYRRVQRGPLRHLHGAGGPGKGRSSVPFEMGMAGFTGVLNTRFHTDIDSWRSSSVTSYPKLAEVTKVQVELPDSADQGFSITYAGGDNLSLFNDQGRQVPMDTARVQDLMLAIRAGSFEGFERSLTTTARDPLVLGSIGTSSPSPVPRVFSASPSGGRTHGRVKGTWTSSRSLRTGTGCTRC